ncbi:MAG TPA: hypothetical protein VGS10_14620 [Terracidiphilus sp.]|nr:hypothetical protein [Terracidiphilus sp.]
MTDQARTIRNGLICTLTFAACFWISWPVAQMGFDDDWSYIRTAQLYAHTGHFHYGWTSAMLGWQVPWGALFIRLFGFSFMAVKLSTLPLACASVFLFYLILIRFGIHENNAIIGTLTLGLSPLFLPLAASFMTDIPSLLVILVCLYCCQRAMAARTDAAAVGWICFAAASNFLGGTVRQIVWLGALVIVPGTAWFLRKRRGVLLAASLLWVGTVVSTLWLMYWFAAQPNVIDDPLINTAFPSFAALLYLFGALLCLLLVLFPLVAAWLPRLRTARGASLLAIASALMLVVVIQIVANWTLPWIPHSLMSEFSVGAGAQLGVDRGRFIFPNWACLLFSALIAAACLALAQTLRTQLRTGEKFPRSILVRPMFWLLGPYFLSYCALLIVHARQEGGIFDRYLLGLMPFAIAPLIRLYELRIAPRLPSISFAMLAFYAFLAIAGTHDWFAWQRARLAAISELRAAGVPRTRIQGGYEYDGWTQLETAGYINDPRSVIPRSAYHPNDHRPNVPKACQFYFVDETPVVHPDYTVAFVQPMSCLIAGKYSPVYYRAWLPPFHRAIYIQRIPAPAIQPAIEPHPRLAKN